MSTEDRAQRERREAQVFRALAATVVSKLDRFERAGVLTPALSEAVVQVLEQHEAANEGALSVIRASARRGPIPVPPKGGR